MRSHTDSEPARTTEPVYTAIRTMGLERSRPEHDYFLKQEAHLARAREDGLHENVVHRVEGEIVARIAQNQWLGTCGAAAHGTPCNGGVALHPEWKDGACFDCGAVKAATFPSDWREIEEVLMQVQDRTLRGWTPGKTIDDLRARNAVMVTNRMINDNGVGLGQGA